MRNAIHRAIPLFLAVLMIMALAACGSTQKTENAAGGLAAENGKQQTEAPANHTEPTSSDTGSTGTKGTPPDSASPTDEPDAESKSLVVYFSRTGEQYGVGVIEKGNTEIVAEMIAELTGADLYEVVPAEDNYPTTYKELTDVAKKEQNDKARPVYADTVPDLSAYSTVFIGAPVWWSDWPMIMYTFFENEELSGKTLIPFCTHAGSGLSGFDKKLSSACPNSQVLDGLAISGADAQNKPDSVKAKVSEWVKGLEY